MIATAVRLFFRHWPVMFALLLLGWIVRDLLMWGAVYASKLHAAAGMLVFALAPLSMLIAMVLILRHIRPSLSQVTVSQDLSPQAKTTGHVASVLVPFLAVYAAYELLDDDRRTYTYRVTTDEIFSHFGEGADIESRLPFSINPTVVTIVAIAIVLRWLFGINSTVKSWRFIGFFQAYLEVVWLTLAAAVIAGVRIPATVWTEQRQLVVWASTSLDNAIAKMGPLAAFGHQIKDWTANIIGAIDTVIIVPIAWLAIGAVIFGQKIIAANRRDELSRQLQRKWNLLPSVFKRIARPLRTDVEDSFTPLVHGLRMIRHAGVRAMLLFCLAFAIAGTIPAWLGELERLLIGPQNTSLVWVPVSVITSAINTTISITVMICLVAAAVDFVLKAQGPAGEPAPTSPSAPAGQPGELRGPGELLNPDGSGLGPGRQNEVNPSPVMS